MEHYDGYALFSGGLDSILASRLLQEQGLRVRCLHFVSPFFGKPDRIAHWQRVYGLEIEAVDVSEDYAAMLRQGPVYGYGSVMNPCVDCKILMMRKTKEILDARGGHFIASGEVLGQRPMSQRRDTLNVIRRDANVKDLLLRPLCARHLDPVAAELSGLVDRERLLGFSGRGRKDQMALAERMGIREIPTPAGGCMLGEKENARRYRALLERLPEPRAADFRLANVGRQLWDEAGKGPLWLSIGRNQADNEAFEALARPGDWFFKTVGFPGPLALGRRTDGTDWPAETLREAAALVASYSPKACRAHDSGEPVSVRVWRAGAESPDTAGTEIRVEPQRSPAFAEPPWEGRMPSVPVRSAPDRQA